VEKELSVLNNMVYIEYLAGGRTGFIIKMDNLVYSRQTNLQRIDVFDTTDLGRVIALDGKMIFAEESGYMYSEMLTHVPLFTHPNPKRVAVIGGGTGAVLHEILKHPEINEVVVCEEDPYLIYATKKCFKSFEKDFSDPRTTVVNKKGTAFMSMISRGFDVIIIDAPSPIISQSGYLFTQNFYKTCMEKLNKGGILSIEIEDPFYGKGWLAITYKRLSMIFPKTHIYTGHITPNPVGFLTYAIASKEYDPSKKVDLDRIKKFNKNFRYYNDCIHTAAFCLPNFLKDLIKNL